MHRGLRIRRPQKSHKNYRDGSLQVLAASMHLELYQLSRLIRSCTPKTYAELLQEKRLSQAAWLLRTTSLAITDICMDVGYHNFSYFYRIFTKTYGCSPKEYRKQPE